MLFPINRGNAVVCRSFSSVAWRYSQARYQQCMSWRAPTCHIGQHCPPRASCGGRVAQPSPCESVRRGRRAGGRPLDASHPASGRGRPGVPAVVPAAGPASRPWADRRSQRQSRLSGDEVTRVMDRALDPVERHDQVHRTRSTCASRPRVARHRSQGPSREAAAFSERRDSKPCLRGARDAAAVQPSRGRRGHPERGKRFKIERCTNTRRALGPARRGFVMLPPAGRFDAQR